jgi:hypothetical protein
MFRRNVLSPSSGMKSKPANIPARRAVCCLCVASCLFVLPFRPEDGSSTFLQNVGEFLKNYIPEDNTLHGEILKSTTIIIFWSKNYDFESSAYQIKSRCSDLLRSPSGHVLFVSTRTTAGNTWVI